MFFQNVGAGREYFNEIVNNWNNVYPLIKPFAYGELPPLKN
jgi:hypothetical protein